MNEGRKTAALIDLREAAENDIERAKKILINAAKYGTAKFHESAKAIPKNRKQPPIRESPEKKETDIDIKTILSGYSVELVSMDKKQLIIKGKLKPFEFSKLTKQTGLTIKLHD